MSLSPCEAYRRAGSSSGVIGWKLDRDERTELLSRFPPKFPNIVADHVTLVARVTRSAELPEEVDCEIVGRIDDDDGVEAMVAAINGTTNRPDGSTYHIT